MLSYYVKLAVGGGHILETGDKYLLYHRFHSQSVRPENIVVGRHEAHMHQFQIQALHLFLYDVHYLLARLLVLRQENHTRAIASALRHSYTLQKNKLVRDLHQNAGTIAGLVVSALCTTMLQMLQHLQCVIDDGMRLLAAYICHHADTTGIMLIGGIVQSPFLHILPDLILCHYFSRFTHIVILSCLILVANIRIRIVITKEYHDKNIQNVRYFRFLFLFARKNGPSGKIQKQDAMPALHLVLFTFPCTLP